MKISEVAKLTGITVRTLHYYDEIGLLRPSEITEAGYRIYRDEDLKKLQEILFFRELEFSLNDVRKILSSPGYDREYALRQHKNLLLQKRSRIDDLIALVDKTLRGEPDMSFQQFDKTTYENSKKAYAAEARERWGNTAPYAEYQQKVRSSGTEKMDALGEESHVLLAQFGEIRNIAPSAPEAQSLVKKWQDYITANFYTCTKPILSCLGQMYVTDERFTQNIDRHGEGTAEFMAAAIDIFCQE